MKKATVKQPARIIPSKHMEYSDKDEFVQLVISAIANIGEAFDKVNNSSYKLPAGQLTSGFEDKVCDLMGSSIDKLLEVANDLGEIVGLSLKIDILKRYNLD